MTECREYNKPATFEELVNSPHYKLKFYNKRLRFRQENGELYRVYGVGKLARFNRFINADAKIWHCENGYDPCQHYVLDSNRQPFDFLLLQQDPT